MLKLALPLGVALLAVLLLRRGAILDFAAWLLALAVTLTILAIETFPVLFPLLPKLLPLGLLKALLDLFGGGQP